MAPRRLYHALLLAVHIYRKTNPNLQSVAIVRRNQNPSRRSLEGQIQIDFTIILSSLRWTAAMISPYIVQKCAKLDEIDTPPKKKKKKNKNNENKKNKLYVGYKSHDSIMFTSVVMSPMSLHSNCFANSTSIRGLRQVPYGDVSACGKLPEDLHCKSFGRYLKVFPKTRPPIT